MDNLLESLNSYRSELLKLRQRNNSSISSSRGSDYYKQSSDKSMSSCDPLMKTMRPRSTNKRTDSSRNFLNKSLDRIINISKLARSPRDLKISDINEPRKFINKIKINASKKKLDDYKLDAAAFLMAKLIN